MRISRRSAFTSVALGSLLTPSSLSAQHGTSDDDSGPDSSGPDINLLDALPGGLLDEDLELVWLDIDSQLEALDGTGDLTEDDRTRLFVASAFGNGPGFLASIMTIDDLMGFGMADLSWVASSGRPPNVIQLVRLNSSVLQLPSLWQEVDYAERENEFGVYWTIGEDAEVDLSHPVQRSVISQFNNIAILNDNTLAFAAKAGHLGRAMAAYQGDAPGKSGELEAVNAGLPSDAVSGWYLDSYYLAIPEASAEMLAESDAEIGPMPELRTLCLGTTAGLARDEDLNVDGASEFLLLETDAFGTAETAADVVTWRIQNMVSSIRGIPYADLLEGVRTEVVNDHLVRLTLGGPAAPGLRMSNMVLSADILPFMYSPKE